jgi:hypothetical protein
VEDLREYKDHVNTVGDGLFDIFFNQVSPTWTETNALLRTATMIEEWAHNMYLFSALVDNAGCFRLDVPVWSVCGEED